MPAAIFRIYRRNIAGRPLVLAIRGQWLLTDEEVGDRIQKIVSLQREFWHDRNFPYYLVTLSTFGREDGGSGGGGFTDAFALFPQPRSSFGYDAQSLLAHETFHTWNPYRMGARPDSSITMSWFTEGFTTYYQDLLLMRAGLLSFPQYVERTNEKLRKYFLSPARNVSNQEVIDRHRTDSASDELPYPCGVITAWLDHTIRQATHGKWVWFPYWTNSQGSVTTGCGHIAC
jgi:predicted metalloprotease with PDZ domain